MANDDSGGPLYPEEGGSRMEGMICTSISPKLEHITPSEKDGSVIFGFRDGGGAALNLRFKSYMAAGAFFNNIFDELARLAAIQGADAEKGRE